MADEKLQAQRDKEKGEVVGVIKRALADLKITTKPLGRWQRHQLLGALDGLERGLFGIAGTCADLAALPTGYSEELIKADPAIDRLALDDFQKWLAALERAPAPLHAILGPRRA